VDRGAVRRSVNLAETRINHLIYADPHRHPRPGTEPITIDTQSPPVRFFEGSGVPLPHDRLYGLRFLPPSIRGIGVCRKPVSGRNPPFA
jgi:hypothetical protein